MKPLNQLTATEIVQAIGSRQNDRARPSRARASTASPSASRAVQAWQFIDPDLVLAAGARARPARNGGAAAGRSGRHEGHHRHRGHADRVRLADLQGPSSGRTTRRASRSRATPAASSWARPSRPSSPTAIPGKTQNPFDPAAHAGRLVERLGRGGRRLSWCRSRSARRPPRRRIRPAIVLRLRRLPADVGRPAHRRREGSGGLARHAGAHRALGRGRRALSRRAARREASEPLPRRRLDAAHRLLPHAALGPG